MAGSKIETLQWFVFFLGCMLIPEIENKFTCNRKIPNFCKKICARNHYQFRFSLCCAHKCPMVSAKRCRSTFRSAVGGTRVVCPRRFYNAPVCYTPDNGTTYEAIRGRCSLCGIIVKQTHPGVREVHPLRCLLRNISLTATLQ